MTWVETTLSLGVAAKDSSLLKQAAWSRKSSRCFIRFACESRPMPIVAAGRIIQEVESWQINSRLRSLNLGIAS